MYIRYDYMNSSKMQSVRSVLIKTCMTNIHNEVNQLEHWLISLPDDSTNPDVTNANNANVHANDDNNNAHIKIALSSISNCNMKVDNIITVLNGLVHQVNSYRAEIHDLNTRIHVLESMRHVNVNVDPMWSDLGNNMNDMNVQNDYDPWVDSNTDLQNDILNTAMDDISEPIYCINKESESSTIVTVIKTPEIIPNIPDDLSAIPDIEDDHLDLDAEEQEEEGESEEVEGEVEVEQEEDKETEEVEGEVEVEQEEGEETEEVEEEETEEVEVEQEEETVEVEGEEETEEVEQKQEEETQEVEVEEEEEEEEEQEEEEEEGIELEEIEYNGKTYYKDGEGFIYSVIDGEPSENPVGYWKEKTQSIAFYKTKN